MKSPQDPPGSQTPPAANDHNTQTDNLSVEQAFDAVAAALRYIWRHPIFVFVLSALCSSGFLGMHDILRLSKIGTSSAVTITSCRLERVDIDVVRHLYDYYWAVTTKEQSGDIRAEKEFKIGSKAILTYSSRLQLGVVTNGKPSIWKIASTLHNLTLNGIIALIVIAIAILYNCLVGLIPPLAHLGEVSSVLRRKRNWLGVRIADVTEIISQSALGTLVVALGLLVPYTATVVAIEVEPRGDEALFVVYFVSALIFCGGLIPAASYGTMRFLRSRLGKVFRSIAEALLLVGVSLKILIALWEVAFGPKERALQTYGDALKEFLRALTGG